MGGSGPEIKSDADIKTDALLEEERIKFQGEKRTFLENVARYELLATDSRKAHESTFEYQVPGSWNPGGAGNGGTLGGSGLFVPAKFNPSFDDPSTKTHPKGWYNQDWFDAPNLGIKPIPPAVNNPLIPSFMFGGGSSARGVGFRQNMRSNIP